jgi:hypothetical protein
MCILRIRRVVDEDDYTVETSQSWVFCDRSNHHEPCPNTESREHLIRVPNGSALSSPGLMPHDTASSTISSAPGTPTSGPRFDIREPLKNVAAGNLRYSSNGFTIPIGRPRSARHAGLRPIISQPDPPMSRGRLNRIPLPTGIRDHRRVHSDSEYEERASPAEYSSDRATEILDRNAAREFARRELADRNRRIDERRRVEEDRSERETALDEEEMRTQRRLDHREKLREQQKRRQLEDDLRRAKQEKERLEAEKERQREDEHIKRERLRREIQQDKENERRRLEKEEEDEQLRRHLDELLEEERTRKSRRAQLEREVQYYQRLEAQLDHAERRRAEEDTYSRQVQEAEQAKRAREIRRAENARLQRERQVELTEEIHRLQALEQRLNNTRRLRQMHPPTMPRNATYVRPIEAPRPGAQAFITHSSQGPTLDTYLRHNPASIMDENIRRAQGENVLDRARQNAERNESAEYRIPLSRRNTIGGNNRARETQYRSARRYPF